MPALEDRLPDLPREAQSYLREALERLAQDDAPPEPRTLSRDEVASAIDHTALKAETTVEQIDALCDEARAHGFASVCVNPAYVGRAAEALRGSDVKVCTVIGFPLGATSAAAKAFETRQAIADGADEVDMVVNVGLLKSERYADVFDDVRAVVQAAEAPAKALVKVIIETALLTRDEKVLACVLARAAGADFVKTSTGFSTGGATPEDVWLMRRVVGPRMGVKASGGVRSWQDAETMITHGATRLGASSSVAVMEGRTADTSY